MQHPYKPHKWFMKGEPIGLDADFVALRVAANEFLTRDEDRSNGWRLGTAARRANEPTPGRPCHPRR